MGYAIFFGLIFAALIIGSGLCEIAREIRNSRFHE